MTTARDATRSPGHVSKAVTSKVYTHLIRGADRTAVDEHAAAVFGDIAD